MRLGLVILLAAFLAASVPAAGFMVPIWPPEVAAAGTSALPVPPVELKDASVIATGAIKHTPLQLSNARRLLQQTGQLPVCEMNLAYQVVEISPFNYTTKIKISNNREMGTHWQLVYRYVDTGTVHLLNATGATILSKGSPTGGPVRLVDEFDLGGASGIPAGGSHELSVISGITSPPANGTESLLIRTVGINGLQCSQLFPTDPSDRMEFKSCSNALSFFTTFTGGRPVEACQAAFCCGYILSEPNAPPPPEEVEQPGNLIEPAPAPEVEEEPPLGPITPPPDGSLPPPSPPIVGSDGPENGFQGGPQPQQPSDEEKVLDVPSEDGDENLGALLGGIVGAAVALLAAVVATTFVLRRRRRLRQITDKPAIDPTAAAHADLHLVHREPATAPPQGDDINTSNRSKASNMTSTLAAALSSSTERRGTITMQQVTSASARSLSADGTLGDVVRPDVSGAALPQEVTLLEQVGSGAFGTVYRGEWGGQTVAVKVLQTACGSASKELSSFRQEVSVLSRLRHPNIITFFAACTVPPNICIIEELAEGGSLHAKLHGLRGARRNRPMPLGELLDVACDVAEAMCYLHPRIVHRDLKSLNVLIDGHGRAKVCDFGIAKFKDRTFVSTVNGQAGTPAYMSPELFDGGSVTEKVDVYSYGIMLWEMLTGKVPWGDVPSPMQIIYYVGVLQQRPPLPPMCQPALRELIQACWSEAPSSRPSFKEILARLRELQAVVQADGLQQFTMLEPVAEEASEEAVGGVDEGDVGSEEAGTATASSTFDMVAMNSYASSTTNTTVLEQSGPLTASTGTAAA